MAMELLNIQPSELRFTFELKKQSSCSVILFNRSDQYVAFKVKTTSPKRYCVRPNVGVIKPQTSCHFSVVMQAERVAPPNLHCKDKFLIQSAVVPYGTTEQSVTSEMFSKGIGKHVEEMKLRVFLVNPSESPVLIPNNGEFKKDPCYNTSPRGDKLSNGIENIPPLIRLSEDVLGIGTAKDIEELRVSKDDQSRVLDNGEPKMNTLQSKLIKEFEELKHKLYDIDSKLKEANQIIVKLTDERDMANREKDSIKHEVDVLRIKTAPRRIQVGFPLLYVCMVGLISLALGYIIHP
ncbi:hypothetical protein K2173_022359 [Erythroxylum novogranatense]|uniref:MSP domain-containing protein n=1 Tax=Erythroxylum novogranatense TaxID=1862640 RepID=A0AAV8THK6_9ROSI|nr:hypothetical protein K2173_022359 [Erythroxylum novogranatense]